MILLESYPEEANLLKSTQLLSISKWVFAKVEVIGKTDRAPILREIVSSKERHTL